MKDKKHPHLENIADLLWLSQFTGTQTVIKEIEEPNIPNENDEVNSDKPNTEEPQEELENPKDNLEVHTNQDEESTTTKQKSAKAFQSPKKLALENYREWEKAFKYINLKRDSKNRFELDEEKTVENIALLQVFDLVFKKVQEKSFLLSIIIDRGETMELWDELIKNFEQMLYTMGVFRQISIYYWDTTQTEPRLCYDRALKRELNESNIMIDGQNNLVWVLSDCIAPSWRSGESFKSIARWSTKSFTSIMQMFPKEMWMGTMLYKGKHTRFSSTKFNGLNRELKNSQERRKKEKSGLKIPIISFDPYALQAWAKVVINARNNSISGVVFKELEFEYIESQKREVLVEDRMKRFYSQASPTAQKLAFYMSILPVDFQVTRILQEEKLKQSKQSHVAEVFLGGLVERKKQNERVSYDFYSKVREELNANISADESFEIMESMSDFVSSHLGIGFDFKALLRDPNGAFEGDFALSEESLAYARLASGVLKRKGGELYTIAKKIDTKVNEAEIEKRRELLRLLVEDKMRNVSYLNKNIKEYHKKAISIIIEEIINKNKRILLSLESGAIRHLILLEVLNKLYKSHKFEKRKPKVLFLSNEFPVLSQIRETLKILNENHTYLSHFFVKKSDIHIYLSVYERIGEYYYKYNNDFFDFIIIDEIPRARVVKKNEFVEISKWKNFLNHFSSATFISFTTSYSEKMKNYFGEEKYRFFISENLDFFKKEKIQKALERERKRRELFVTREWNYILNTSKIDDLEAFIKKYPKSIYMEKAKEKIVEIETYLSSLPPAERRLEELYEKETNKSKSKVSLLFTSTKKGLFDNEKYEALILLKQMMKDNKQWKEVSRAKNIKKDKWYQRTLYVIDMIKKSNN